MTDPKKIIHGGPCIDCTAKLGRLEPHAAVLLDHDDCQAILTQGLRIIATHADHTFSIAGAVLRTRSAETDAKAVACPECGASAGTPCTSAIGNHFGRVHEARARESDRQLVLMALAHLSVERPGFDDALQAIALQIDNQRDGRALMYDEFRQLHRRAVVAERKGSSRP